MNLDITPGSHQRTSQYTNAMPVMDQIPPSKDQVGSPESVDLEMNSIPSAHLSNDTIQQFSWQKLNVVVKDRKTGSALSILDNASGIVHAGEMLAIMGPSGSGKTTLLNALAHRVAAAGATTEGDILVNGSTATLQTIRDSSCYVEQEDALIGSLTVKETMMFAARLSLPS